MESKQQLSDEIIHTLNLCGSSFYLWMVIHTSLQTPSAPAAAPTALDKFSDSCILMEGSVKKKSNVADAQFHTRYCYPRIGASLCSSNVLQFYDSVVARWLRLFKSRLEYSTSSDSAPREHIDFTDIVAVIAKTNVHTVYSHLLSFPKSLLKSCPGQNKACGCRTIRLRLPLLQVEFAAGEDHGSLSSVHTFLRTPSKWLQSSPIFGVWNVGATRKPLVKATKTEHRHHAFLENHWRPGVWEEENRVNEIELHERDWLVVTSRIGHFNGQIFAMRSDSVLAKERWVETIGRVLQQYDDQEPKRATTLSKIRRNVRSKYVGDHCQVFVASLIMGNFLCNIFEAQFVSSPDSNAHIFDVIDVAFTVVFTIELCVNMFSTLVKEFVMDYWNWFDVVVVLVSLISLVAGNLPGADVLRLMRCFRVFRLFKRIPSLRQIIVALSASIPPMFNAFVLVCLVTAIYSIMSVTFFRKVDPENFGDFFTAMFTMFQVGSKFFNPNA